MLLLPHPFGPTTAVTPRRKSSRVRSAKLLNPFMDNSLRYMNVLLGIEELVIQTS